MRRTLAFVGILAGLLTSGCAVPAGEIAQAPAAPQEPADDPELIARGEDAFQRCKGCHRIGEGERSTAGPNLYGVFGRTAGSVQGYPYTSALRDSGIVWDADTLDLFLADPRGFVPGSEMARGTVRDAEARQAIIAYLRSKSPGI